VDDGQHTLSAIAYDDAGNVGRALSVDVTVANAADESAPVVTITEPTGGSYDRRVQISAHATDDQAVTRLDILGNGKLLCSGTSSASCSWNLRKVSDGTHTVTARAFDAAGNRGESSVFFVKGSTSSDSDSGSTKTSPGKGRKK
jgi:hypothetical protein